MADDKEGNWGRLADEDLIAELGAARRILISRTSVLRPLTSAVAAATALAVAVGLSQETASTLFDWRSPTETVVPKSQTQPMGEIGQLRREIASLRLEQQKLTQTSTQPDEKAFADLGKRFAAIELRQGRIEEATMSSPDKALAVPMLRRELDNQKESFGRQITEVQRNIDQVYDLTKWFLGALTLGVFSLAINSFFPRKKA